MIIDIHSYCNARCTMCPYPSLSRKQSQGIMEWPLYEKIIDDYSGLSAHYGFKPELTYCYMSEVFLGEDLPERVSYALKREIVPYLLTNASVMTAEKVDALLATGFSGDFHISFHGITREVFERICGLDYQTTLDNILYLLSRYDPQKVLIRGVDDNWPTGEQEKWLSFWRQYNVQIEYLPPISRAGSVRRFSGRTPAGDRRIYGCQNNLPLNQMVVLFDGRVVLCCQDMKRRCILGDLNEQSISELWNGRRRRELLETIYNGKPVSDHFICAQCEESLDLSGMLKSYSRLMALKTRQLLTKQKPIAAPTQKPSTGHHHCSSSSSQSSSSSS